MHRAPWDAAPGVSSNSSPWTGRTGRAVSGIPTLLGSTLLKPGPTRDRSNPVVPSTSESAKQAAGELSEESGWIERACAGDTAAFRRLVERYSDLAYGLALRMLGSAEEAEETAQDAFVRAWRALPRFRGDSRFSTWLYRIVARRALDRSAALKVRRAREGTFEDAALEVPAPADARGSRVSRRLDRLLESLPEMQRAAVVLYYYEDRSVEEVARTLGLPPGTVKTHLHRARALLRAGWELEERRSGIE